MSGEEVGMARCVLIVFPIRKCHVRGRSTFLPVR